MYIAVRQRNFYEDSESTILKIKNPPSVAKTHSVTQDAYWFCIVIHVIVVIAHVVLVFLWHFGIEKGKLVPLGSPTNRLSVGITITSQIIGIVSIESPVQSVERTLSIAL